MGYNFNKPWRLTELENQTFPKFVQTPVGNCSVDLKLGNSGGLEDNCVGKFSVQGENLTIMESSSSSGSLKRVRTATSGNVVPSCLVDGCTSDLSKCRDYHRRHKVCELHSKTSKVFIRGLEQRFCQQCSRFHSLVEFDEGKRSCRKRLDGHNRRRRKPQPDTLSINSANLFSNHQGTRYLHFGGSPLFSGSDLTSGWTGPVKTESDPMLYTNQSLLNIGTEKASRKQFQFSQCSSTTSPISQPVFNAGSHKMYNDSNRALSLLSSPRAETREISLVHVAQSDQNPGLNFGGLGMETGPVDSVLISGGNNNANEQNQDLFQIGLEGSSGSGSHQTISFSWE